MANGIIVSGVADNLGELRVKQLANKFLEVAQGYEDRELLSALAVCAGCTIRARYNFIERYSAFEATVNIMQHCKDQP